MNPLGLLNDGVLTKTDTILGGGFARPPATACGSSDLARACLSKSRGRPTQFGNQLERFISFKLLHNRAGADQRWPLNVARTVQAFGHQQIYARGAAPRDSSLSSVCWRGFGSAAQNYGKIGKQSGCVECWPQSLASYARHCAGVGVTPTAPVCLAVRSASSPDRCSRAGVG